MSTKATGLAAFTRKSVATWQVISITEIPARQRPKNEIVAITLRLQRAEWERLQQFAVSEGMSIQSCAIRGLNKVFAEKALPWLREQ
jgi:hypothetical protein